MIIEGISRRVCAASEGLNDSKIVSDSSTAKVIRPSSSSDLPKDGIKDDISHILGVSDIGDESFSCIDVVRDGFRHEVLELVNGNPDKVVSEASAGDAADDDDPTLATMDALLFVTTAPGGVEASCCDAVGEFPADDAEGGYIER